MTHSKSPSHSQVTYQVGEVIDVKYVGRATVIEDIITDPSSEFCGRYRVRYHEDDKTFYCKPARMRKVKPATKQVVVAYRTEDYRTAVVQNVNRSDVCIEVGCHVGVTTVIMHNRCKFVVGIDNSDIIIGEAKARAPHVRFEFLDGFDVPALRKLSPSGTFDVIGVDISGKASLGLITRLVALYIKEFPHARILVKNEELYLLLDGWESTGVLGGGKGRGPRAARADPELMAVLRDVVVPQAEVYRHKYNAQKGQQQKKNHGSGTQDEVQQGPQQAQDGGSSSEVQHVGIEAAQQQDADSSGGGLGQDSMPTSTSGQEEALLVSKGGQGNSAYCYLHRCLGMAITSTSTSKAGKPSGPLACVCAAGAVLSLGLAVVLGWRWRARNYA